MPRRAICKERLDGATDAGPRLLKPGDQLEGASNEQHHVEASPKRKSKTIVRLIVHSLENGKKLNGFNGFGGRGGTLT